MTDPSLKMDEKKHLDEQIPVLRSKTGKVWKDKDTIKSALFEVSNGIKE